tara:strand:- start:283 stop:1125 length:843 start_codon:yes stop_codon:yes gene_type:complete
MLYLLLVWHADHLDLLPGGEFLLELLLEVQVFVSFFSVVIDGVLLNHLWLLLSHLKLIYVSFAVVVVVIKVINVLLVLVDLFLLLDFICSHQKLLGLRSIFILLLFQPVQVRQPLSELLLLHALNLVRLVDGYLNITHFILILWDEAVACLLVLYSSILIQKQRLTGIGIIEVKILRQSEVAPSNLQGGFNSDLDRRLVDQFEAHGVLADSVVLLGPHWRWKVATRRRYFSITLALESFIHNADSAHQKALLLIFFSLLHHILSFFVNLLFKFSFVRVLV